MLLKKKKESLYHNIFFSFSIMLRHAHTSNRRVSPPVSSVGLSLSPPPPPPSRVFWIPEEWAKVRSSRWDQPTFLRVPNCISFLSCLVEIAAYDSRFPFFCCLLLRLLRAAKDRDLQGLHTSQRHVMRVEFNLDIKRTLCFHHGESAISLS